MMVRAKSGDYFNRAALLEDLQAVRTLYRDHGYANVDATPQTNLDPATQEVDVVIPVERGPLVYFERIEVRGNSKTRDKVIRRELEVTEGQTVPRNAARQVEASHHGARLLRAGRHLDRAGLRARQDERLHRGERAADGDLPGRRRLLERRKLHRHGADPAGEPVRQRAVAVAPGPAFRAAPPDRPQVLRAVPARQPLQREHRPLRPAAQLSGLFAAQRGRRPHVRLPDHRPRAERLAHLHGGARRRFHSAVNDAARHLLARERVSQPAAREPVQRRLHVERPPRAHLRHA